MVAKEQLVFVVFLIHALSASWGKSTAETYSIFKESGVLKNYIIPCYDVLHSLGTNYLIEDITGYVEERGIKIRTTPSYGSGSSSV